jgi:peroxiredoxin
MLEVGSPFPKFSLFNQDGKTVTLRDFAGKWLVVYVYPKDDTPGARFKANRSLRRETTTGLLESRSGVSRDDVASHKTSATSSALRSTYSPTLMPRYSSLRSGPKRIQRYDVLESHEFCN